MSDVEKKLKKMTDLLISDHPELQSALESVQGKDFQEQITTLVPILTKISETVDMASLMERSDIIYTNEQGTERLNPKYEAYLIERIQFDGDAPELRTGATIQEGGRPAVPVQTSTRNPVGIGAQLKEASESVQSEMKSIAQKATDLVTMKDPVGYERGKLPTLRETESLTAKEFMALSVIERKELTWGFISTTQGRVSAVPVLSDYVKELFDERGIDLDYGKGNELRRYEWVLTLSDGHQSTQQNFSYIDIAAKAFVRDYSSDPDNAKVGKFYIEPINRIADRLFGWAIVFCN